MSKIFKGLVTFVNHEKETITIEYKPEGVGKAKTINGGISTALQNEWKQKGIIKKAHQYYKGDTVQFITKLSDRGDKMIATNIQYVHNEALDVLLNKAKQKNEFVGYIKLIDGSYFVKEVSSYRFFQLQVSPWQQSFTYRELSDAVLFYLANVERKEKATAVLFKNKYLPAYIQAEKLAKTKTPINAKVIKITDYGMYINVVDETIQAKLPDDGKARLNDVLKVVITYISPMKIVVEQV